MCAGCHVDRLIAIQLIYGSLAKFLLELVVIAFFSVSGSILFIDEG